MASLMAKFSYYRLRNDHGGFDEEAKEERAFNKKIRSWSKIRKFVRWRRPKVRIPGLRRFLRRRRRFLSRFKVSWGKALKRLKNGQAHTGDLFSGNYLFMQVNPTPFRSGERPNYYMGYVLNGHYGMPSSSRYTHGRVSSTN